MLINEHCKKKTEMDVLYDSKIAYEVDHIMTALVFSITTL